MATRGETPACIQPTHAKQARQQVKALLKPYSMPRQALGRRHNLHVPEGFATVIITATGTPQHISLPFTGVTRVASCSLFARRAVNSRWLTGTLGIMPRFAQAFCRTPSYALRRHAVAGSVMLPPTSPSFQCAAYQRRASVCRRRYHVISRIRYEYCPRRTAGKRGAKRCFRAYATPARSPPPLRNP